MEPTLPVTLPPVRSRAGRAARGGEKKPSGPAPAEAARDRLSALAAAHGLESARRALDGVAGPVAVGLAAVEADLAGLVAGPRVSATAARHLVAAGGKRVRPAICLLSALAAGAPIDDRVRSLATVAEAIHGATLLHDDVIDLGEVRRGAATARAVYGNAASVLGGDLLLVRALEIVERTGVPGLLPDALDVLARMIEAEALQLERRGSAATSAADYLAIVLGKTASLFAWAAVAGARAAGAPAPATAALERFGRETGVAFQVMDDLLDLVGDAASFGKGLLADVREGKVTYPLIHALAADPGLAGPLEAAARGEVDGAVLTALGGRVRRACEAGGGLAAARAEVAMRTGAAVAALDTLPASPARDALAAIATALAARSR